MNNELKLNQLNVKNFKSIENGSIENIDDVNILIGKNNVGKTSFFEAIALLKECPIFPGVKFYDVPDYYFTGIDFVNKNIEIEVVFSLNDEERKNGIFNYTEGEASPGKISNLLKSDFMKRIKYAFRSTDRSTQFGLFSISMTGTDGNFANIATRRGQSFDYNVVKVRHLITSSDPTSEIFSNSVTTATLDKIPTNIMFPFALFDNKIKKLFLFSSSRNSEKTLPAKSTKSLDSEGNNLVQRIYSIRQNEDDNWDKLEQFVKLALPGIGNIRTRTPDDKIVAVFASEKWGKDIDIHEMGFGIRQLIMMACVLISRDKDHLILIENPENHLHPGAQRILMEFIKNNIQENQIMITSHSTIFLNQKSNSIFTITNTPEDGTKSTKIIDLEDFSFAMNQLGSRNSDILMADFVFFVEGKTDEMIFKEWAKKLDIDLDSKNIFFIPINGCRNFNYYANSDILEKVTLNSPVPHLFIIDSDEKSDKTISQIKKSIKKLHILERREIENYLLDPEAIRQVLLLKTKSNLKVQNSLAEVNKAEINKKIINNLESLKKIVLLKRIREDVGGGSLLPYSEIDKLIKEIDSINPTNLCDKLTKIANDNFNTECKSQIIEIVKKHIEILNQQWQKSTDQEKMNFIPGEEILAMIFSEFGLKYKKNDGFLLAQHMSSSTIPKEINQILSELH